jgi:hypothetical protein
LTSTLADISIPSFYNRLARFSPSRTQNKKENT